MRLPSRQINRVMLLLLCLMMSGCSSFAVKSNTVEEISPIIFLYLDQTEDGQLQLSTIIPPVKKEKKTIVTTDAAILKEGKYRLDHKYYREMKDGQLRIVFISETLARKGIMDVINTLLLDPEISDRVYLAVADGDMIGYLNNQLLHNQEQIDFYLYKMLSHYEKQRELTVSNLHQFMESWYDPYADPVIPLFKVSKTELEYEGTALFQDDRMTGAIRPPDDVYFQMLYRQNSKRKAIPLPDMDTTLGEVYAARRVRFSDSYRAVQIDVRIRGRVEEYPGNRDLSDPAEAAAWTRTLESHIESDMERFIRRIQALSVDPLLLGEHTLGLMRRPLSGEQWKQRWPHVQIHVRVNVNLEHMGMLKPKKSKFAPKTANPARQTAGDGTNSGNRS
jgi:spore germination protein